jgi:hypothetical protein
MAVVEVRSEHDGGMLMEESIGTAHLTSPVASLQFLERLATAVEVDEGPSEERALHRKLTRVPLRAVM